MVFKSFRTDVPRSFPSFCCLISGILICVLPSFCHAQATYPPAVNPATKVEESVLVQDANDVDQSPTFKASANGSARINDDATPELSKSTFTAQPLPSAPQIPSTFQPQPPSSMLVPEDPTEDTFTKPFTNELRGESLGDAATDDSKAGTDAVGTFATTNQDWQDQPFNPSAMRAQPNVPSESNRPFQQPSPSSRLSNSEQRSQPRTNYGSPAIPERPALPNSATPLNAGFSDQPSQWKEVPGQGESSRAANMDSSYQPSGLPQQPPGNQNFNSPRVSSSFDSPSTAPPARSNNTIQNAYDTQPVNERVASQSVIQPTGFNQPADPSEAGIAMARSLISRYATDNFSGQLPGQPVKLLDLLGQPIAIQQRKPMIVQYWTTYYDWAMWVNEQETAQWLNRIPAPGNAAEKAMLDVARVDAKNRMLAAKIQLGKSQSKLVQFFPNWNSQQLPIPNDLPLILKYRTNFEAYQSYRLIPANLRGIDQMLPDTLELIASRAGAVELSKDAADKVLDAVSKRQVSTVVAIEIARQCRVVTNDLVASVISYNQAITDYSLTVARGFQTPEQIVEMLIGKPKLDTENVAQRFNDARQQQRAAQSGTPSGQPVQNVGSFGNNGSPSLIGSRPNQPSSNSNQPNGLSPAFDPGAFQNSGQAGSNSRQERSVLGGPVAPATPVGQNAGNPNSPGGTFRSQTLAQPAFNQPAYNQTQPTPGNGVRAAQSPFGPPIGIGR